MKYLKLMVRERKAHSCSSEVKDSKNAKLYSSRVMKGKNILYDMHYESL